MNINVKRFWNDTTKVAGVSFTHPHDPSLTVNIFGGPQSTTHDVSIFLKALARLFEVPDKTTTNEEAS